MSQIIIVPVKDGYGTYTARFGKRRASCTSGERQAVKALAEKILGAHQRVHIAFLKLTGQGSSEWMITLDTSQRCRICGCNCDSACEGGCHWVEADLCSACMAAPVTSGLDRTTSGAIG